MFAGSRVAVPGLSVDERRDFSFLTMIWVSFTLACLANRLNSCRLWCFHGKVTFVPFSFSTNETLAYKFTGKNLFGSELGLRSEEVLSESQRIDDPREIPTFS